LRLVDYSPEQMHFLEQGRAVDTTAMRQVFGYSPRYTTSEAYDDFLRARLRPVIDQRWLHALEAGVLSVLSGKPADVGG
jgi:UDP-glucose 4-epimerase